MLLFILGLFDILIGFALLTPNFFNPMLIYLAIIVLIKGGFSLIGSISQNYWFDWMGVVDIIAGFCLFFNLTIPYFWLLLILKGLYSILTG